MAAFHFELVSPDKQQFNGPAQSVLAPGVDGDFQVLRDHAPVMTTLRPGILDIGESGGKHTRLFVRSALSNTLPLNVQTACAPWLIGFGRTPQGLRSAPSSRHAS